MVNNFYFIIIILSIAKWFSIPTLEDDGLTNGMQADQGAVTTWLLRLHGSGFAPDFSVFFWSPGRCLHLVLHVHTVGVGTLNDRLEVRLTIQIS